MYENSASSSSSVRSLSKTSRKIVVGASGVIGVVSVVDPSKAQDLHAMFLHLLPFISLF